MDRFGLKNSYPPLPILQILIPPKNPQQNPSNNSKTSENLIDEFKRSTKGLTFSAIVGEHDPSPWKPKSAKLSFQVYVPTLSVDGTKTPEIRMIPFKTTHAGLYINQVLLFYSLDGGSVSKTQDILNPFDRKQTLKNLITTDKLLLWLL
ncbi:MAG: hypothetical protein JNM24_15425 [Bdellovibrionaceae bacterium]|nr:hypothetical protein [Pseudobdellovibrionaceae bacterium]